VLYEVNDLKKKNDTLPVEDLAASFQATVVSTLFDQTMQAAREYDVKEIIVAGGVSANRPLRNAFQGQSEFKVNIPAFSLCTDNAAMIAAAGYYRYAAGQISELNMDVRPNWPLS
jgi:N6-L-threonylcarbamoyladenine synthase